MLNPLLLLVCCVLVHDAQSASVRTCSDDADCLAGNFCYLQTQRCTPCTDCGAYQRRPASSCAREPAQCGECISGFEQEILLNGNTRGLCIRVEGDSSLAVITGQGAVLSAGIGWWWPSLALVVVASTICGMFVLQKKWRQCLKIQWQTKFHKCNDSQTSLSCTPFAPSAPPAGDAESEARMFNAFFNERTEEKCQQASKYLNPVYVRDPHHNNNNNQNEPVGDVVDGPPEQAPFLMEENTLPSDWTPGTDYDGGAATGGQSSETLVTSFAGILQLNSLASGPPPLNQANHSAGPHAQDNSNDNHQGQQQQFVTVTNIVINNGAPSATGIFNISQS